MAQPVNSVDEPVRVVIADDEVLMRAGLRLMVDGTHGITVVGEARTGREAVELVQSLEPDVVLMDVRMPEMDGLEATTELTAHGSKTRVVVLTAFDTDDYLLRALQAGACSFLLKDSPPEAVVEAIVGAARDEARFSPAALRRLVALAANNSVSANRGMDTEPNGAHQTDETSLDPDGRVGTATSCSGPSQDPGRPSTQEGANGGRSSAPITEREWEVARLVAQGLTNAEIAGELFLSLPTVKTHLGRLFDKLQVTNRVQLALKVIELGG